MRIARIQIQNFRNFKLLDIPVGEHAVIVGENCVGKSNLIFALRLILDPTLPDSVRKLRLEDFWDGLPRPLTKDDRIEISVDLAAFEDNEDLLAILSDLGTDGLQIPFAVVTDEDPTTSGGLGISRLRKLIDHIQPDFDGDDDELLDLAKQNGLFLTEHTFEVAMWKCGRRPTLKNSFLELVSSDVARQRCNNDWKDDKGNVNFVQMLRDIENQVWRNCLAC
jgi:AAA ATPase domain